MLAGKEIRRIGITEEECAKNTKVTTTGIIESKVEIWK